MNRLASISSKGFLYDHIVGTGGIGSGIFFSLKGNETLGREESRMATLLPYKDYCKQHIIMHYVAVLLGAETDGQFRSFPIGRVGMDDTGKSLVEQMKAVGMDTSYVKTSRQLSTLFSVCYQYPDHAGGNITTAESASSEVSPEDISDFFSEKTLDGKKEIVLAVPEVRIETRIKLLELASKRGSLKVASVQSSEINEFRKKDGFRLTDILSVNMDEARNIVGEGGDAEPYVIAKKCAELVCALNHSITLLITCGAAGVYVYAEKQLQYFPALKVAAVSTAGAGDAFLAGCIAGVCCGLSIIKNDHTKDYATATELGILLAALSVTSPDTIHPGADANLLYHFLQLNNISASAEFLKMFI